MIRSFLILFIIALSVLAQEENIPDPDNMIYCPQKVFPVSVPGKSVLVFLRPFRDIENDEDATLYVDYDMAGVVQGGTYFIDTVNAGVHRISCKSDRNWNMYELTLPENTVTFVLANIFKGYSFTGFQTYNELIPVSYSVFKDEIPYVMHFAFDPTSVKPKNLLLNKADFASAAEAMDSENTQVRLFKAHVGSQLVSDSTNTQSSLYNKTPVAYQNGILYRNNRQLSENEAIRIICHNESRRERVGTNALDKEVGPYNSFIAQLPDTTVSFPIELTVDFVSKDLNKMPDKLDSSPEDSIASSLPTKPLPLSVAEPMTTQTSNPPFDRNVIGNVQPRSNDAKGRPILKCGLIVLGGGVTNLVLSNVLTTSIASKGLSYVAIPAGAFLTVFDIIRHAKKNDSQGASQNNTQNRDSIPSETTLPLSANGDVTSVLKLKKAGTAIQIAGGGVAFCGAVTYIVGYVSFYDEIVNKKNIHADWNPPMVTGLGLIGAGGSIAIAGTVVKIIGKIKKANLSGNEPAPEKIHIYADARSVGIRLDF